MTEVLPAIHPDTRKEIYTRIEGSHPLPLAPPDSEDRVVVFPNTREVDIRFAVEEGSSEEEIAKFLDALGNCLDLHVDIATSAQRAVKDRVQESHDIYLPDFV